MLLNTFAPNQKLAFLKLVRDIATVDKSVDTAERSVIKDLCNEMGISAIAMTKSVEGQPLESLFNTAEVRALVIVELARLSLVDKTFSFGENEILNEVRRKFGFTRKDLDDALRLGEVYTLLRKGITARKAVSVRTS